jgi:PPP family 3-phenylpropionic acid transporter
MAAGRRILLAYLVYFGAIGTAFPYLPVFYHDLGLRLEQIGLLTSIGAGIQLLLAPMWGGLADRFPRTRLTLPLAAGVATVGATILLLASDFEAVLFGSVILFAGIAGIAPALDARTLETLGPERRNRYGEVRAFGSLAFVVSTVAVGFLLDAKGARSMFWAYLPLLVATIVVTATIPRRGTTRSVNLMSGAGRFIGSPGVALFLGGFTVVWAALSAVSAFYSIQVVALGGSPGLVGIAWAFGAVIEVPLMYAFPRVAARVGTERLVVLGSISFGLRASLASVIIDPVALVLIAPLEGLGFACVFVGGVTLVSARAPAGMQGTAQGLFAASSGLATIIGAVVGGAIAGALSIPALFLTCAAVSLVGTVILAVALLGPRSTGRIGGEAAPAGRAGPGG